MTESTSRSEEFQFSGDTLLAKIKEIIREGNIRRVVIKNEDGRVLIDIPLTIGVVGTLLAPQLAAIGAIAALVLKGSIVIEKEAPPATIHGVSSLPDGRLIRLVSHPARMPGARRHSRPLRSTNTCSPSRTIWLRLPRKLCSASTASRGNCSPCAATCARDST